jgi:YgiT-type zinc finger domain-containing protein
MNCVICKNGVTALGLVTVTLERGSSTLVFRKVPAQICENCGEAYVADATTAKLLDAAETAIKAGVQVEIRNFDAA